jgi:hypothetical protein
MAQNSAAHNMLKWSLKEENPAIQDTFLHLSELTELWTGVQNKFAGEMYSIY